MGNILALVLPVGTRANGYLVGLASRLEDHDRCSVLFHAQRLKTQCSAPRFELTDACSTAAAFFYENNMQRQQPLLLVL